MTPLPLRGALIGAGRVTEHHLTAWARIPQAEIVAIADPDLDRARSRAGEFGIPAVFARLEDVLGAGLGLDFLDIAAPPEAHLALVRLAAEHGLPVLCQKPLAHSLDAARQMIALCERAGTLLCVNENWRWRPWFRAIRSMITAGEIGLPLYARFFIHSSFRLPGRELPPDHRARHWDRVLLFDWGIHHVDIMRFLFGEPASVYARLARVNPALSGDDRAVVVLAWDGDLTALLDLSATSYDPWGAPGHHEHVVEDLRIEGDRGTIRLVPDPARGDLIRVTTASETREQPAYDGPPFDAYRGSYMAAQRHFIACVRGEATPETPASDNFETLAITLAAYHSAATGQVVRIADFKQQAGQPGRDS